MRLEFAPLDGITKTVFRQVWRARFGGADRYFLPFISPTDQHIFTDKMRRELSAEPDELPALVPQIMTRRADDFLWAAEVLAGMGFREVNLNLGCPSGTVTAKGKGSGLLLYPDELAAMLEEICWKSPLPVSVKTRLGYREPEEFPALLEIFNRCPVKSLIVHPRTRPEKYKGPIHTGAFALAAEQSRNPLCYNGEIRTPEDAAEIQARFPSLDALMIGRGAVADPALFRKLRGGPAATREELQDFTAQLYQRYQDFYGAVEPSSKTEAASQRMKEVWFYLIHLFDDRKRYGSQMRRSRGSREYLRWQAAILQELPLRDHSEGPLA